MRTNAAENKAVFLSYASQDADAARCICEALRSEGVEVWFDQNELVGGDVWDAKIRKQIADCALFVPIISANTNARDEGYFRLEWKLAVDRTHLMAHDRAFLLPVIIDGTADAAARVPPEFRAVQWTRLGVSRSHGLPAGETMDKFCGRVTHLLRGEVAPASSRPSEIAGRMPALPRSERRQSSARVIGAAVLLLLVAGFFGVRLWKGAADRAGENANSVVVLPFANLSADKDNEYLSDGIAGELLTVLQKIPGLRVAARTSAWSFKGRNPTAREVGETLGMAHVVEGTVQKSGNAVKVTARLSRAATNEEIWSKSFGPRELTDVFALQTELAHAIVSELRGRLVRSGEIEAQVAAAAKGGTKNPAAYQLYLQGRFLATRSVSAEVAQGVAYFEQALKLDPAFTMAWGALARARLWQVSWEPLNPVRGEQARTAATAALALDGDFADAHSAVSQVMLRHTFDWRGARAASARALQLAPNDPAILTDAAATEQALGSLDRSVELARRAVALDPVSVDTRYFLAMSYQFLGRLKEAEEEARRMIELSPSGIFAHCVLSIVLLMQDRNEEGLAEALKEPEKMYRLQALAMAHYSLGHRPESDAALQTLIAEFADTGSWAVGVVYIWRGERDQAFHWLERAWELRDAGVSWARGDTLVGRLRNDRRWPEYLRKIGLHDDQLK